MFFQARKVIGIMGSGSQFYPKLSIPLAQWIAKQQYHLLTGGGGGVMVSAAEAFCRVENRQGISIGILPTELTDTNEYVPLNGYPNPWIELAIASPLSRFNPNDQNKLSRNYICVMSSDLIVALPGNIGTRNEIELALCFNKPIILFGWQDNEITKLVENINYTQAIPRAFYLTEVTDFVDRTLGNK